MSENIYYVPADARWSVIAETAHTLEIGKVIDNHAIIPTGVVPTGLSFAEQQVCDEVCRHFIAVFYPDCQFATTTMLGKVEEVEFKTSGKQILVPGWREVIKPVKQQDEENPSTSSGTKEGQEDEEKTLPIFTKAF